MRKEQLETRGGHCSAASGTGVRGAPEQGKVGRCFGWSPAASVEHSKGSFWEGALGTEAEEGAGAGSL